MKFIAAILLALLLCCTNVFAQIDSFYIGDLSFKVRYPANWKFVSMTSGLCNNEKTNLLLEMPLKCTRCYGSLSVSISNITAEEREERAKDEEDNNPLKIDNSSNTKEIGDFTVGTGYYESWVDNDTFLYTSASGQFVIKKALVTPKQNKRLKLTPIHYYTRWYYLPINDTLEMVIIFNGMIAHDDETPVDIALSSFTQSFFTENKKSLDSLFRLTSPYRAEPEVWPLDSLIFWNTMLKYPKVDGWQYDTTTTAAGKKKKYLQMNLLVRDSCDEGRITITSDVQPVDPKKYINKKYATLLKEVYSSRAAEEYVQKATDTTGFAEQEQHYYFDVINTTAERSDCNKSTRYLDTVHVYIYLTAYERIDMTVAFTMSSSDEKQRAKYYHDFGRFITELLEANDFERVYQLNRPFVQSAEKTNTVPDRREPLFPEPDLPPISKPK